MIIDDLHVVRVAIAPLEAQPPLIVDTDAREAGPIASELLEPIPRRNAKIREFVGGVQDQELPKSGATQLGRPPANRFTLEDALCVTLTEALDRAV